MCINWHQKNNSMKLTVYIKLLQIDLNYYALLFFMRNYIKQSRNKVKGGMNTHVSIYIYILDLFLPIWHNEYIHSVTFLGFVYHVSLSMVNNLICIVNHIKLSCFVFYCYILCCLWSGVYHQLIMNNVVYLSILVRVTWLALFPAVSEGTKG